MPTMLHVFPLRATGTRRTAFTALVLSLSLSLGAGACGTHEVPGAPGDEGVGTAQQANKSVTAAPPTPFLNPNCQGIGSNHAVTNPGAPSHEVSTCAAPDGFSFADAVTACGSAVKYFGYSCSDFPQNPPYRLNDERGWTSYYGCCAPTCADGIQNHGEAGIDCGGPCPACGPSCSDGIKNQGETRVDCGGPCAPCEMTRWDYCVENGGPLCGGPFCAPCITCEDGIQNQGETGVDCGGPCLPCECFDGIQNQDEAGVDCGGVCEASSSCDDN